MCNQLLCMRFSLRVASGLILDIFLTVLFTIVFVKSQVLDGCVSRRSTVGIFVERFMREEGDFPFGEAWG